jgi:hypothetical protein
MMQQLSHGIFGLWLSSRSVSSIAECRLSDTGFTLASGERYEVPHPDFILALPRGSYVIVIDNDERPHHLNALLIDRASSLDGQKRHRIRKRR